MHIQAWVKGFAIFCQHEEIHTILLSSWRWQTKLDCEMPSSPDTLWQLLTRFAFTAWSKALESMVLGLLNHWGSYNLNGISWTICLLYCHQLCLHLWYNKYFWLLLWCYDSVWTHQEFPNSDYVAHSFVWFSNHTWSEAKHMTMHQLPQYYQSQQVISTSWTATWYICYK